MKSFASNALPTLEDHLKLAQNTASKVGVSSTAASGHATKKGASKKGL